MLPIRVKLLLIQTLHRVEVVPALGLSDDLRVELFLLEGVEVEGHQRHRVLAVRAQHHPVELLPIQRVCAEVALGEDCT